VSFWRNIAVAVGATPDIPQRKRTLDAQIRTIEPPAVVAITVGGLDAVVSVGDEVDAGQLIARSPDNARWIRRRHSSLVGTVAAVSEATVTIEGTPAERSDGAEGEAHVTPATIVERIERAGVVGMGGAMFPTYVKLSPSHPVDTVLINGCESEPYFTCDHRVLTEQRSVVERGMKLAMQAVGAKHGLIIEHEAYYPAGYERFVIRDHLGRLVPNRGLPRDVGVLVLNVQTAMAIRQAVDFEFPVTERVITVDGDAVGRPGNYVVPIGTRVGHILTVCETDMSKVEAITAGGPMMGRIIDPEAGITAGTGGVLALTAGEIDARQPQPCLRCGRCFDACPVDLPVALLLEKPNADVLRCMGCGACQYVCPASLPLVDQMRLAKSKEIEWD